MKSPVTWPSLPQDVIDYFKRAFAEANRAVSELICNNPPVRETSLDDAIVQSLVPRSAPTLLPSGAVVRMDIHNIGGLRRMAKWEIADIGVFAFVYYRTRLVAQKVAFLQAKRLYPSNNDVQDDDAVGFAYGMNLFLQRDTPLAVSVLTRSYEFNDECYYGALKAGSEQIGAIDQFVNRFGKDVYYLLYNPPLVPLTIAYPKRGFEPLSAPPALGARVVPSGGIHTLLQGMDSGRSPSLRQVQTVGPEEYGYRLEHWASELLLTCKVGRMFDETDDAMITSMVMRRSGPIGAAIAISVVLPDE